MNVLFLTQEHPFELRNGAQKYTHCVLEGILSSGHTIDLVVLRPESGSARGCEPVGVSIHYGRRGKAALDFLSLKPRMVEACASLKNKSVIGALLPKADMVVVDHLASTACLNDLKGVPIWYVAHNDEMRSKKSFLRDLPMGLRAVAHAVDYFKIVRWQRKVSRAAAVLSFISESEHRVDEMQFGHSNGKSFLLEPYTRPAPARDLRSISERALRIAIIGTFKWTPKRLALHRLIDEFGRVYRDPRVELVIAGSFEAEDVRRFRDVPGLRFVADFHSPVDVLKDARIGLMVDGAGGGFKMKFLDYISCGCAVYALETDVASSAVVNGRNAVVHSNLAAVIREAVVDVLDDGKLEGLASHAAIDFSRYLSESDFNSRVMKLLNSIDSPCCSD